jgi:hypothetical protein
MAGQWRYPVARFSRHPKGDKNGTSPGEGYEPVILESQIRIRKYAYIDRFTVLTVRRFETTGGCLAWSNWLWNWSTATVDPSDETFEARLVSKQKLFRSKDKATSTCRPGWNERSRLLQQQRTERTDALQRRPHDRGSGHHQRTGRYHIGAYHRDQPPGEVLDLTGELANGWIGNASMPEHADAFLSHLRDGATRSGRSISEIELVIPLSLEFADDVDEAARRHSGGYAFTIGAMGSAKQNFYNAAFERQGFGDDIAAVQALWLDGKREKAAARVPIEIGMHTNLLGTPSTVKERLREYRAAGINTLQAKIPGTSSAQLDPIAQLIDIVREVNGETITQTPTTNSQLENTA